MIYAGLILIVLFLCYQNLKLQGYRITKVKPEEIPEKQKEEAERKIEAFDKVMNYSLDQALERKRVI